MRPRWSGGFGRGFETPTPLYRLAVRGVRQKRFS
jgi:hypothetical protein